MNLFDLFSFAKNKRNLLFFTVLLIIEEVNKTISKTILGLFVANLLLNHSPFAGELLFGKVGFGDTTDKINYKDLIVSGTYNERDLFWPYLNETSNSSTFGLDYYFRQQDGLGFDSTFHEVKGRYNYQFKNKHRFALAGGLYQIDEQGFTSKANRVLLDASVSSLFSENFQSRFFIGKGSAVREVFQTGRNLRDFDQLKYGTDLTFSFFKQKVSSRIMLIRSDLKNDVERTYFDSEVMVSLMTYPHWIRVGMGYHTLDYNKNTSNYWSPLDFYAWGPRLDFSYVFTPKIQYFLGGNYSWFEENNTFAGSGYYMRTGFKYGLREDFNIDLSYERNESVQNNNSWVGKSFLINANYFL